MREAEWIEHNDPNRIVNNIWFECKECGYGYPTKFSVCPHCRTLNIVNKYNKETGYGK